MPSKKLTRTWIIPAPTKHGWCRLRCPMAKNGVWSCQFSEPCGYLAAKPGPGCPQHRQERQEKEEK